MEPSATLEKSPATKSVSAADPFKQHNLPLIYALLIGVQPFCFLHSLFPTVPTAWVNQFLQT